MMFFSKKKTVTVDAFCCDEYVRLNARPELACKFYPAWWKDLPKTYLRPTVMGSPIGVL